MRRLILLTTTTLAAMAMAMAMAMAATPALATVEAPHGDLEADNWQAVTAYSAELYGTYPCEGFPEWFTTEWGIEGAECQISGDGRWHFYYFLANSYGSNCEASIEGTISYDGTVVLTNATWDHNVMVNSACAFLHEAELPWQGKMCAHLPTGEFWLRQEMSVQENYGTGYTFSDGVTFGRVGAQTGAGTIGDQLGFGNGRTDMTNIHYDLGGYDFDIDHAAGFLLDSPQAQLYASGEDQIDPTAAPCSWNELQ